MAQFLIDYPGMAIQPGTADGMRLEGEFAFECEPPGLPKIVDRYWLAMVVPANFPAALPRVYELARRIPRDGTYHVNSDDTLCLGSPLRLLLKLWRQPTLSGFAESCLVPYLYAASHRLQFGGALVFSELAHGAEGAIADYVDLFGMRQPQQVLAAWTLLGLKPRHANKRPCPCGCGKRLGKCQFNQRLLKFRRLAPPAWFRSHRL